MKEIYDFLRIMKILYDFNLMSPKIKKTIKNKNISVYALTKNSYI